MSQQDSTTELGWYVSDVHCRRAIGYLSAKLAELGYLVPEFESPRMLALWGEALEETMNVTEPSPIGPEPEHARKFLLSTIEERITQLENRDDRMESAIVEMNSWLHKNLTRYLQTEAQKIEKILYEEKPT